MIGVILFALFFVFLFMGLPVGFALGVSSLAAIGHRLSDYGSGPENVYRSRFFPADGDSIVYACGSFNEPRRYHEAYH